jgi:hypothetical protein
MHLTTIYRLPKRVQHEGEGAFNDGRHGHPVKLRGEIRAFLLEHCQNHPSVSSSAVQRLLAERFGHAAQCQPTQPGPSNRRAEPKVTVRGKKPEVGFTIASGSHEQAGGLLLLAAATETDLLTHLELAEICREYGLWFHVDGAYGALAALLLNGSKAIDVPADHRGIREADSVAVDPHKWLYAPLEAGCALVREAEQLRDAFSYHPPYYPEEEDPTVSINYYEYGPQNSRGFRALKVWLALSQAGREGYVEVISSDIQLAQELYQVVEKQTELQAFTRDLSISTFRYVPVDLIPGSQEVERYLNELNTRLLTQLQKSGTGGSYNLGTTYDQQPRHKGR